jgi:hypothetical protein
MAAADAWSAVRAQLARVSAWPADGGGATAWPASITVVAGVAIGVLAGLAAAGLRAIAVAPAVAGVVAVVVAALFGAAVIERGGAAAYERWLGLRWAASAAAGTALLRVVALWSTAPSAWWGALIAPAALGRLAAVGLQRIGDVAPAPGGRSLVIGRPRDLDLALAVAVVALAAGLTAGGLGLAIVGIAVVVAIALGLAVQVGEGELASDSLAVVAAAVELVAAVGFAAIAPAARSPFIGG